MNSTKFQLVKSKFELFNPCNKYQKKAKKDRLDFYTKNIERINSTDIEKIEKHDFRLEAIELALKFERLDYFYKNISGQGEYPEEQSVLIERTDKNGKSAGSLINLEAIATFFIKKYARTSRN